jgi:hypothetical protein
MPSHAERSGLLKQKSSRIAGRVGASLVQEAKRRTGIEADTDLIAFALANVALEDNQLMAKHRVLSLKPQLRLEWRGQRGQSETGQPIIPPA